MLSLTPTVACTQPFATSSEPYTWNLKKVFNPAISLYNGASGPIEAVVHNGPTLLPQRKGRLPQYNRNTLEELQDKFEEPEASGVCAKPEQVNVHVEYLNTSFLVKEPNGGSRLVTSFGDVAQPSALLNA